MGLESMESEGKWQTKAEVEVEGAAFKIVEEIINYLESVE